MAVKVAWCAAASCGRQALASGRRTVSRSAAVRTPDGGGGGDRGSERPGNGRGAPLLGNPAGAPYGYRGEMGPSNWYKLNEAWLVSRDGRRQSPVDLVDELAVRDASLTSIVYKYQHDRGAKISNDGTLAAMNPRHAESEHLLLLGLLPMCHVSPKLHTIVSSSSFLKEEHELVQYHFHFAADGLPGSEHALDGKRYPAEVHFVHYKKSYGSFAEALKHSDGLAVVGAMLDIGDQVTCSAFDSDIRKMKHVKQVGKSHLTDLDLSKYMIGSGEYFLYEGSLTSPPCFECVHWIILKTPVIISNESFHCLTELESAEGGHIAEPGNFRPLQPLNARPVRSACFAHGSACRGSH